MKKFTQEHPASRFGEAYPVGNGHMGAVVYGSFPVERIVLTENTFFSGKRSSQNNQKGASDAFYEMRRLLKKGDYEGAHRAAKGFHGARGNYGTSLPAGTLEIDFSGGNIVTKAGDYSRSLDYENGIAETFFCKENLEMKSEAWASHPDQVLVWHIKSSEAVSFSVSFHPYQGNGKTQISDSGFTFISRALETRHCDDLCGTTLYGGRMAVTDGQITGNDKGIRITDAREAVLYLAARTDYELLMKAGDTAVSVVEQQKFMEQTWSLLEKMGKALEKGLGKGSKRPCKGCVLAYESCQS